MWKSRIYCRLGKVKSEQKLYSVDIKGSRMYIGAKEALTKNLNNVGFLRTRMILLTNVLKMKLTKQAYIF